MSIGVRGGLRSPDGPDYALLLVLLVGKKLAKRFKGAAKAGKNTLKKKLELKPGRYKIALKVKAGGETATDTAKLRVTPPG